MYLILILVVGFNRPWSHQQKMFLLYLTAASLWGISDFLLRSPWLLEYKILLFRLCIIFSLAWVVQLYAFGRAFMNLSYDYGEKLAGLIVLLFAALCFAGIIPPSISFADNQVTPAYGWWMVLYVLPMVMLAMKGVYSLVQRMRVSSPEDRNKTGYLICAVGFLGVFGFAGIIPLAKNLPLSHVGGLLAAMLLTYAVVRHELISIDLVLRRTLGWISVLIIGVALYEVLLVAARLLYGLVLDTVAIIFLTIATVAVAGTIYCLRPLFLRKIDQLFYHQRYEHRNKLHEFVSHSILGVSSLEELGDGLLNPLISALDCQQAFILLPEKKSGHFIVRYRIPWDMPTKSLIVRDGSPILEALKNQHLTRKELNVRPDFKGLWKEEVDGINDANIELLFPFISKGKTVGILGLARKQSGKYSIDDINLVENLTNNVTLCLEKERYHNELANMEKELSVINHLTGIINSNLSTQDVFEQFIDSLQNVVDVEMANIGIIDNSNLKLTAVYNKNKYPWHLGDTVQLRGSGLEWVVLNKKGLAYPNSQTLNSRFVDLLAGCGLESGVIVPLINKDETIGILTLARTGDVMCTEEQVQFIEQLASQIATSVVNSDLYARSEMRARIDELTGLFNRRHFDEYIDGEISRDSRYGNSFSLIILDLDHFKSYNDLMGHSCGDKLLKHVGQIIRESTGEVDSNFRYGGDEFSIILPNATLDSALRVAEKLRQDIEKAMQEQDIPITASLGVSCWPSNGIIPQDLITAADRALYYAKNTGENRSCTADQILPSSNSVVTRMTTFEEQQILNTIYALAATIEARDRHTYGHSRKVRSYAVALAEAINLSPEKVTVISHAALLHDIGKIGIYDTILNKPDVLTVDERQLVKRHPQLSRDIVANVPNLTPCLPAILHHHERWDGRGYPHALKGENIPLEARIIAIADSFDAMTSARPYRDPLPGDQVMEELRQGAGSQFDLKLVEAFMPIALKSLNNPPIVRKTDVREQPTVDTKSFQTAGRSVY